MRILGIDPGSRRTGWGVLDLDLGGRARPLAFGVIVAGDGALAPRLVRIGEALEAVLEEHRPDVVGVEQAFHAKSARSTLVLGQVRGVCLWVAARRALPIHEYAPRAVKLSVTGRGGAAKPQVGAMVKRLLELARAPQADAADALAVALCCARRMRLDGPARRAGSAQPAGGPRTARTSDGAIVDLSQAFTRVRRGDETRALKALVARRGERTR